MAEHTRTSILLIALAMLLYGEGVFALEITANLSVPLANLSSSFGASQTSDLAQWFDNSSQSTIKPDIGLRLGLSDRFSVVAELSQIGGRQYGKVGKYECIAFGCSWLPSKLVTGIEASESVSWQFTRLASRYEYNLPVSRLRARLRAGLDLIYGEMAAHAGNETYTVQGLIPVPAMGLSIGIPLENHWSIEGRYDHAALYTHGVRLDAEEASIQLQYRWNPGITTALGYRSQRFDLAYARGDTQAALAVASNVPFVRFAYQIK